jgi:ornithine cyclodeaminase
MPLVLSEEDVKALVTMDDLIEVMEIALADFSSRAVTQPVRTVLQVGVRSAFYGLMPAYVPSRAALGTKLVTVFESNAERGLPTHLATIVLLDPETGALLALLDGRYITEARTAAVSAVSAQWLARENASAVAVIGSGVQARSHLEAMARVRDISEVRVWSRKRAHVERFISDMTPHVEARFDAAASARAAVDGADIVVLATSSAEPVVHSEWISDGAHICAVGACRPVQREMDAALVARADLFVDSREAARVEAGDIVLAIRDGAITESHIKAELGEVIMGTRNGRSGAERVTVFKSLGLAVEDVVAAHLVYERARVRGVGKELTL